MPKKVPEVLELWSLEANCAQATAKGLLQHFGFQDASDVLFNSFFPYGGGFSERSICGAVTGTLAALSYVLSQNVHTQEKISEITDQFKESFINQVGSLRCRGILTPFHVSGDEFDMDNQERRDTCTRAVEFASQVAKSLLASENIACM